MRPLYNTIVVLCHSLNLHFLTREKIRFQHQDIPMQIKLQLKRKTQKVTKFFDYTAIVAPSFL